MTDGGHISQEDLAIYATQSLPAAEAEAVRAHLSGCRTCALELSSLLGDLALLGLTVEQHSLPEDARRRFLDRIAAEPVLAPVERSAPPAVRETPPAIPISGARPRSSRGSWASWLAAAAMAIVAIALGVENRALDQEVHDEATIVSNLAGKASRAQQVFEVLTSPSAQRVTLTPGKAPGEPVGHATYLPDRGGLIFQANNLKSLPQGKTYELWVIPANGKPPMPAGLFRPNDLGAATLVLPELPSGVPAKAFGVTVENAGGSDAPTSPILLSGAASGG